MRSLHGASRFVRGIRTERSGGLPMHPLPATGPPAGAIDCTPGACLIGAPGRASAVLRGERAWVPPVPRMRAGRETDALPAGVARRFVLEQPGNERHRGVLRVEDAPR